MDDFYELFQSSKFDIVMAGYLNVGTEWKQMVGDFQYVRIYYIRSGNARLNLVNENLELKEGNMYFIPSSSIFSGVCEKQLGHYFIHIIPDLFTEHFFKLLTFQRELPLDRDIADYLFLTVIDHWKQSSARSRIATESALHLIFSYFFGDSGEREIRLEKFKGVFDYIDNHLCEKIYLKDLASLIFMDEVYFSNIFKKTFGLSPQQYILQKKLDRARRLLANPELTISGIASTLNFFDGAALANFFKKQTGMTPNEFRRQLFRPNMR